MRLTAVEEALEGQPATADGVAAAGARAGDGLSDLNADIHAGADYRRAMVGVFAQRALRAALRAALARS